MKKQTCMLILAFFLAYILLTAINCRPERTHEKSYYDQFRNTDLKYEWDFNGSMMQGGHTHNSTYFQLRKHSLFNELCLLGIPYSFQYKHEEGHIYQSVLLNTTDIEQFYDQSCKTTRPDANFTIFRDYFLTVTEGAAEYYAVIYFENSSVGRNHIHYLIQNKDIGKTSRYYQGFMYVNKTISEDVYKNQQQFIKNICSEEQYQDYLNFSYELNDNDKELSFWGMGKARRKVI